jgi:hypothetical protein
LDFAQQNIRYASHTRLSSTSSNIHILHT